MPKKKPQLRRMPAICEGPAGHSEDLSGQAAASRLCDAAEQANAQAFIIGPALCRMPHCLRSRWLGQSPRIRPLGVRPSLVAKAGNLSPKRQNLPDRTTALGRKIGRA